MKCLRLLLTLLFASLLATGCLFAQTSSCPNNPPDDDLIAGTSCDPNNTLTSGQFQATPLVDGAMQDYGDNDHNITK